MTDFDMRLRELERQSTAIQEDLSNLRSEYENAREFTQRFLERCGEKGITGVSIGRKHPSIPATKDWPFGHRGSIFQFVPEGNREGHTWPAIWGVVDEFGIGGGCGNKDQKQADTRKLIDGVYHLKEGKWIKVDE